LGDDCFQRASFKHIELNDLTTESVEVIERCGISRRRDHMSTGPQQARCNAPAGVSATEDQVFVHVVLR